ncbi:hypothetical protein DXG03_008790 [Asterophora parasitica]|uniref:FAD-binding domain-containing protein n=1 Tax=Asterophora parasitica TaxID=117018 RepID=A0A9P7G545_9AGAR|nr:hypothetical protein DXG03_008790 [Asterophora parasitica]
MRPYLLAPGAVALSAYPDIDVEVYEAAEELAEVGAGIGIFPRPWEIIRRLGLEEELLQYSEVKPQEGPVTSFRYRKGDQTPGQEFYTLVTNGNVMLFHRADFQQRLRSYTQRQTGPIELLFEDGSTTTCDVLVGADGLKSAVRRSLLGEKARWAQSEGKHTEAAGINASVHPVWSGTSAYRALIPAERLKSRAPDHQIFSTPTQYLGKNGYIIAYPISHGKHINFVAFIAQPDLEDTPFDGPWVSATDSDEFGGLFSHWEPEVQDLIANQSVDRPLRWAVHTVKPLSSFISGRVALIGDAVGATLVLFYPALTAVIQAHAMGPHQGSGAGQAIEDAYILATVLGHRSTTQKTLHHALRIFNDVRRPKALEVAEKSRRNGQLFMMHGQQFEDLAQDVVQHKLRTLSEEFTEIWKWAWTTSVNDDIADTLMNSEDLPEACLFLEQLPTHCQCRATTCYLETIMTAVNLLAAHALVLCLLRVTVYANLIGSSLADLVISNKVVRPDGFARLYVRSLEKMECSLKTLL